MARLGPHLRSGRASSRYLKASKSFSTSCANSGRAATTYKSARASFSSPTVPRPILTYLVQVLTAVEGR